MKLVDKPVDRLLTVRQRMYAEARVLGLSITESALRAGCPDKWARKQGSRFEHHAGVLAHIERLKKAKADVKSGPPPLSTDDPMETLKAILRDPAAEVKAKIEAAKALMPYMHKRIGETGKKEQQREAAGAVAAGSRFGGRAHLKSVK